MADLSRQKKKRGGHRAVVTTLIAKIKTLLSASQPDNRSLDGNKVELQRQSEIILVLDAKIVDVIDEDHISKDIQESSEYAMKINVSTTKLLHHLTSTSNIAVTRQTTT